MPEISNTISLKITSDTKNAKQNIDSLSAKLKALKKTASGVNIKFNGLTPKNIESIDKFSQLNTSGIEKVTKSLAALSQVGKFNGISQKAVTNIERFVYAVDRIRPGSIVKLEKLANAMAKMNGLKLNVKGMSASVSSTEAANDVVEDAKNKISSLSGSAAGLGRFFVGSALDKKLSGTDFSISSLSRFVNLASRVYKGVTSISKSFTSMFDGIDKKLAALGRIATYRLIRRAIQLVSQAFVMGTENVYAYSRSIGSSLSFNLDSISSKLMQMKNSIGSAVEPLVNALTPAIITVINAVTVLFDRIAQLISLLGKFSTYSKAIGTSFSFEDAISGAGKAAGSASKELNKFTASIDELNVISESSYSGGSSSYDPTSAFSTELLEFENVSQIVSKVLEDMRSSFDKLPDVGTKVANWMKGMFDSVNPQELGQTISSLISNTVKGIKNFTEIFAQNKDSIRDGISITISEALSGLIPEDIVGAVDNIVEIGVAIIDGIRSGLSNGNLYEKLNETIDEVDWNSVGELLYSYTDLYITTKWKLFVLDLKIIWKGFLAWYSEANSHSYDAEQKKLMDYYNRITNDTDASTNTIGKRISNWWLSFKTNMHNQLTLEWSRLQRMMSEWWLNIKTKWFSEIDNIKQKFTDLVEFFKGIIEEIKSLWSSIDWSISDAAEYSSYVPTGPGAKKYASGGYPTEGEFFYANENGPELVGRIGNRTAVANQGQIVDAVSAGVYEAVMSALGSQKSSRENINLSVYLDGKQIESSVRKTTQNRGAAIANGGVLNYSFG